MSSEGILQGRGWRARQGLSRILAWPPELWPRGNLGGVWGGGHSAPHREAPERGHGILGDCPSISHGTRL